jgi:hypothetical protein
MPITKRSKRRMTALARRVADLHNDAALLARRLRVLAHDLNVAELGFSDEALDDLEDTARTHNDIGTIRERQKNFKAGL